jgi:hypothetical protein
VKYGVLTIAAGVFLGILAALGVYKAFEVWQVDALTKRNIERQKVEARTLQTQISEAASNLGSLTPDRLVAVCGPPLRDHFQGQSGYRFMDYLGGDGHRVNIEFMCIKERCSRIGMHRADATVYDEKPSEYETFLTAEKGPDGLHDALESQVKELPCLVGLSKASGN